MICRTAILSDIKFKKRNITFNLYGDLSKGFLFCRNGSYYLERNLTAWGLFCSGKLKICLSLVFFPFEPGS
ncbi:hypothetical protein LEP1GSC194_2291 [Leptospira alstonii serovar Sichuan str. 79601]|uniref:Uncharacterized protein n=1 Tax=Leptospira alstonii serovar Sichuan str. 79601 TaxID=1218565 RepID=M6CHF5_9LEPT|nr:hypothetical protein LEP1GSC194_2291 [Leptospira alstonii serovar Sichuan str. 79601]